MRLSSAFVAIALTLATGSVARAIPNESPSSSVGTGDICTTQCAPQKPECPVGKRAVEWSKGCWKACCEDIDQSRVPFKDPLRAPEDKSGEESGNEAGDEFEEEAEQ